MSARRKPAPLLVVDGLHVEIGGKQILKGLSLKIHGGEIHALMGPNGSGKSSLAYALAGHPDYVVTAGRMRLGGKDLAALAPEERAALGLGLAFQYPVEIPGVSMMNFLKTALNAQRTSRGAKPLAAGDFLRTLRTRSQALGVEDGLLKRQLNVGFSGGEKKRNELLQLALLAPRLAVLDEIDSGLDVDALQMVASVMRSLQGPKEAQLIITHYQRLLHHVRPTHVHILADGRIMRSGGPELAEAVEASGYAAYGGASAKSISAAQGISAAQARPTP